MTYFETLHEKAISCARHFHSAQAELLKALGEIDEKKVFRHLGYSSLHDYAIRALKLSDALAYALIAITRKSTEVPELKSAVLEGRVNISKASRIVSVINSQNKKEWLDKAQSLPQRELEREVAAKNLQGVIERIKPLSLHSSELRCSVSRELENKILRVKNILSQKYKKPVSLEETLEVVFEQYLQKKDPIRKAERKIPKAKQSICVRKTAQNHRTAIPAAIKNQILVRDQAQCAFQDQSGIRCESFIISGRYQRAEFIL